MSPIKRISSGQVRAARGFAAWSIDELSAKSGVATNTISRFERGRVEATLETLLKLQATFEQEGIDFPDDFTVSSRRMKEKSDGSVV